MVNAGLTLAESVPDETGHDTGGDEGPETQEEDTEADGDADAEVAGFCVRGSHDETTQGWNCLRFLDEFFSWWLGGLGERIELD